MRNHNWNSNFFIAQYALESAICTMWINLFTSSRISCQTRMWNMISSPATPTVCLEQKLRIFKVATWHYRCLHNLKNNCIWDNLQCCLLVPRSHSKPVMLTLTCNLEKCNSLRSSFGMYNLERQLRYWHLLTRYCPCNLLPEPTSPKHEYREKLWGHPVTSSMTSSP